LKKQGFASFARKSFASLGLNGYVELNQTLVNNAVHQFMHGIFS